MTPTQFEFTVTMPGDSRLVGAVRQLAAQAAGYAQLETGAGEGLAAHVERATEHAIAGAGVGHAPISVRFAGDEHAIDVVISYEAAPASSPPAPASTTGVTVEWSTEGSRHICHIRQLIAV